MNLTALGSFGANYAPALQQLQQKAQAIQQAQMQIDAAKRELAGNSAQIQNLLQMQPQQQGQPQGGPPPGAPPMPGQTPQAGPPPPQQGMPQPPMPGQSSAPMGGPPPGATASAAPPQPQMPQGGQQQPGQAPGAGGQDLSPQAQMQLLAQIAQSIKKRSPGIDNLTLFEAVKQQIGLMTALSNTQKQQLVFAADQIKARVQTRGQDMNAANTKDRDQTSRANTQDRDTTSAANTKTRVAGMLQATQARIADANSRLDKTQAAINARQDKSIQGRANTKVQTERLGLLRTQLAQARQKLSAAAASGDTGAVQAAQQGVDAAFKNITDFQQKVSGPQASPGAAPPAGAGGGAQRPTATSADGKKVEWDGQNWVPVGQ